MEAEYSDSSSDDSVWFGPYTMAEAKRDVEKGKPRNIDRRHSSICRYRHYDISQQICELTNQLEEATISSQPSEYFTPNETTPTEQQDSKSSEFLEKLSKAINEPVSEFSFNTACDEESNNIEDEATNTSIITISDDSSTSNYELSFEIESPASIKQELSVDSGYKPEITQNSPNQDSKESNSPIQVPEINLNQFDDSYDLDDTMEEINRFLREGENHKLSPETPKTYPSAPSLFYSAEKICKPSVEVDGSKTTSKIPPTTSRIKPPSVNVKTLFSKTTPKSKAGTPFKIPNMPVKKTPTPNKSLKNVVSPISVYINHSRKYVPMINVPQTSKAHNRIQPQTSKAFKENIPQAQNTTDLPPVIYKPAKTKLVNETCQVKLPESIRKLVNPSTLIRHEQRIAREVCNESIERRLMESDLSIDVSQFNQDMSIITCKQAFDLN